MTLYVKFSTAWPRKPEFRRAGPMARLIYVELTMFCKENLTDGEVDDANLADFAVDVPKKKAHMQTLVDVGALERTANGYRIPPEVWRKWNPTKAEVEAKTEAERKRKAEYRNRRMSQDGPDDVPTGQESVSRARPTTPEPEPSSEPEPEPEPEPSGLRLATTHHHQHGADDEDDARFEPIIKDLTEARVTKFPAKTNGFAYRSKIAAQLTADYGEAIRDFLAANPDTPAATVAARFLLEIA